MDSTSAPPDAARRPHWGFFGTLLWGAAIMGVFYVVQLFVMAFVVAVRGGFRPRDDMQALGAALLRDGTALAFGTLATMLVCGLAIAGAIKLKRGATLKDYLALHPVPLPTLARWVGLVIVLIAISDLLNVVLGRPIVPEFMRVMYPTADPVWLLWLAVVFAAPLFEEPFFRGFLFRGFESSFLRPAGTVVVTAAAWAVIHVQYDLYDVVSIFILGVVIGVARLRTRSLYVPLTLHGLTNFVAMVEAAVLR